MNWKKQTVEELRRYSARKESLAHMEERIQALRYKRQSIKATSNTAPVQGGSNQMEDRLIDSFCEEDKLRYNMQATTIMIHGLEKALESLNPVQRKVLDRFYINPVKGHVECLCEELGKECAQVYRIKDAAIRELSIRMFGVLEV